MFDCLAERTALITVNPDSSNLAGQIADELPGSLAMEESPVRLAVTESNDGLWRCEVGVWQGGKPQDSIFRFVKRDFAKDDAFNVVMVVPTGIGAEIGGHAGDATPAATLIASVCDTLVTHPNVLNASDIIQVPANALYVEGSVISRLLMGTAGLRNTRSNRVLVIIQEHEDDLFRSMAYNAVNAARAIYGMNVSGIVEIDPAFRMVAEYTASGMAAGRVHGLCYLWDILDRHQGEYDAVAITSIIEVPANFHRDYYEQRGEMVNPWGGVEAILTHAVSLKYGVPAAHSPMLESREIAEIDLGIVDSRMAAEAISMSFLQSVLRGLQKSPRVNVDSDEAFNTSLNAGDIDCLVIPDGVFGHPDHRRSSTGDDCCGGQREPEPHAERPRHLTMGTGAIPPGREFLGGSRTSGHFAGRPRSDVCP